VSPTTPAGTASWAEVVAAAPALAAAARERFEAHPHHVLATLHADGRPRCSGTNVMFDEGRLWIGSMADSRKGADLRRDPRLALHSCPLDEELAPGAGDARIEAVAHRLPDDVALRLLREAFGEDATIEGDMFELAVTGLSLVTVEGDHMRVRSWTPEGGERDVLRS
jgi:hypothetical protein